MSMGPEEFVRWMSGYRHKDPLTGITYQYHPRSDSHSKILCKAVLKDLLDACPTLAAQAKQRDVVYGINVEVTSLVTGKRKTLDLSIGLPSEESLPLNSSEQPIVESKIGRVLLSCEAKSVMTEHSKSKPRVYDELNSSHDIVHQGWPDAIATGIAVVNVAASFVSPLRQRVGLGLHITRHTQPKAAADMVQHLRGLRIRDKIGDYGFDAYTCLVVECDNQCGDVRLWSEAPAPRRGEKDHYERFIERASELWQERFSTLPL
jgi:hypothetical protein